MGVAVSIDGQPNRDVSTGDALTPERQGTHASRFRARVHPVQLGVDAGERDSTLVVSVPVKPATLVVDGDVSRTYQNRRASRARHPGGDERRPPEKRLRARHDQADRDRSHGLGPARGRKDDARGFSIAPFETPIRAASEKRLQAAVRLVGSCPACVLGPSLPPEARLRACAARLSSPCCWPRALTAVGERARADAVSDLEKAHNAYVAHKYDDAETRLRALLDPRAGTLKDADNIADARMYLGASLLAQGKKVDAEGVFEQLLRDKPDYQPDSLRVSLQATDALIDVRSRMREELAAILAERVRQAQEEKAKVDAERQKAALRLAMLEKLASEETVIQVDSRWLALVPFGVGQFQNGQTALGWTFLATESLLAAGSAISQLVQRYNEGQMNAAIAKRQRDRIGLPRPRQGRRTSRRTSSRRGSRSSRSPASSTRRRRSSPRTWRFGLARCRRSRSRR